MSNPARYNFTLVRGDDFTDVWTIKDSDGVAVDLSSASARMVISSAEDGSGTDYLEADSSNSTIVLGADGTMRFAVPRASTESLDFSVAYYDAHIVVNDLKETILFGNVTLKKDIA
jgi:hypothetical protein